MFFQNPKTGVCNPWPADQKWPGSWGFVARRKGQIFKQTLRFLKGISKDGLGGCRPKAERIFCQISQILGDKSVVTCNKNNNKKIEGRIFPGPEAIALVTKWLIRHWVLPISRSTLSNTQSLTHAAVGGGPIWLCAFDLAVLYGCTPLPETPQLTDCCKSLARYKLLKSTYRVFLWLLF